MFWKYLILNQENEAIIIWLFSCRLLDTSFIHSAVNPSKTDIIGEVLISMWKKYVILMIDATYLDAKLDLKKESPFANTM